MPTETGLIENWLYATLSGDATLVALLGRYVAPNGDDVGPSIFSGQAPLGARYPVVYFEWIPGGQGDLYYNGSSRCWSGSFYRINSIVEGANYAAADPISERLDELLSISTVIPVTGGNINYCRRLFEDRRARYEGAQQEFRELGAFWNVIAQAT